jgi:Uma2 family endonuclease
MASAISTAPVAIPRRQIPPLANGDRLTRVEFERRYAAMPPGVKAELIEGVVYMASPVRHTAHANPHGVLSIWLGYYLAKTPGLLHLFGDNGTVRLDNDNEPQPDLYLMLPPAAGGQAKIDADGYISGPPTLVCEIAASSVSIDLHYKMNAYRRNGVHEYLVWRTEDAAIDWFALSEGQFLPIAPEADGTLRSRHFPGLWLLPSALLAGDLAALFAVVDSAAGTPEHAEFVAMLKRGTPTK